MLLPESLSCCTGQRKRVWSSEPEMRVSGFLIMCFLYRARARDVAVKIVASPSAHKLRAH